MKKPVAHDYSINQLPGKSSAENVVFAAGLSTCDLGDVCEGCAGETCDACAEQAQFEVMDRMRREGL